VKRLLPTFFSVLFLSSSANDTLYARYVIKHLTGKKCYGRGYLRNGLEHAEDFIVSEIKKTPAIPVFNGNFSNGFVHPVNTFPAACALELNGQKLEPGRDFIPDPSAPGLKGKFRLQKTDSVTFVSIDNRLKISFRKKLTYSVGRSVDKQTQIEVDRSRFKGDPGEAYISLKNRFIPGFRSSNIACMLPGTWQSDSMIVFTAHYDHLGGIGKKTWFPGGNDNASGVSFILNLLKYYSKNPPQYKTVFIFFAAEEAGLVGSKHFVSTPPVDLKKIKFLVNLDLLGTGDDGIMVVNGAVHEEHFKKLERINEQKQLVKQVKKRGKAANSDHYWFSEAGVPAFFIYTMGGRPAYHDVFDTGSGLPLTDYIDVFNLLTTFVGTF
jgi:aminopeptidase YwaD